MNREDILNLEVGKKLNSLIAEKIFGIPVQYEYSPNGEIYLDATTLLNGRYEVKRYSTDISAAWEIVEKLKHKLQIFTYTYNEENFPDGWLVKIGGMHVEGISSAPEAICKAALLYSKLHCLTVIK